MRARIATILLVVMLSPCAVILSAAKDLHSLISSGKDDFLTEDEADQIREAQDPSQRIGLYLSFAQVRLDRIDEYRQKPPDPEVDVAGYLAKEFDQYIRITDELKNWIEDQYERRNDMRSGLKKALEVGPHQLEQLRHMESTPDPYTAGYRKNLNDAIDDFSDAVDGATKALSDQSKQFGELKREEKADAQTAKEREKEEKKRAKEEKKLRKKENQKGVPTDQDVD